jgi:hypothetical protein
MAHAETKRHTVKRKDLLLPLLGLIVTVIGIAVPAYVAYELYSRGPSPEKRLEVEHSFTMNPAKNLSTLASKAHLTLTVEGKTVSNLVIAYDVLRNVGHAPLLPTDYFENLTVSVAPPWNIVIVDSSVGWQGNVSLRWKRKSDTTFEAEPSLLNPGDTVSTAIYLTNAQTLSDGDLGTTADPIIKWDARIINLPAISTRPSEHFDEGGDKYFPIEVRLHGHALLFTLITAMLFEAVYINLLVRAGLLHRIDWRAISLVLCASLLSFSAAESSAWYLFPTWWSRLNPSNAINACVLVTHWSALLALYLRARKRSMAEQ